MSESKASRSIGCHDRFIVELCKVLGLPKRTKSFTLRVAVGKLVEVDCTYLPSPENPELVLSETFELVRANGGK